MFIYALFFIIIILPFFASQKNKIQALKVSFFLLFLPLAFQYEVCHDWKVNLQRWMVANESASYGDLYIGDSEPLYLFILHLSKPFGFFGFLIISAAIQLWVFYKLIKRYVSPKYYWVSLFILIVYVNNFALYYINSNRQTYSMLLTISAVWILFEYKDKYAIFKKTYMRCLFSIFIIISAHFIHTAAYAAIGLIGIYFFVVRCTHVSTKRLIIACNVLFFLRFFIDVSQYQYFLQDLWSDNMSVDGFENYFNDLEEYGRGRVFSLWQQTPMLIAMNLMLIGYNKICIQGRFFILCSVFSIISSGFLVATLQRAMQYYAVYTWVALPMVLPYINGKCNELRLHTMRNLLFVYLIAYALFQFQQNVNPKSLYYDKWYNYTSIFEATIYI